MKILAITNANLRRMLRERSNIFFVFIFPIAIILLIGAQFGGGVDPAVGVTQGDSGELSSAIVAELQSEDELDIVAYETGEDLTSAVELGNVQAGVFIPSGLDDTASSGQLVEIGFVARPDGFGAQLQSVVGSAVSRVMTPVSAAQFATEAVQADFATALDYSLENADVAPGLQVEVAALGEALFPETLGQFDLGAAQQLVLFVFLTALTGSAALILTRQLGISSRMLSTPTSIGTIITGEGTGRWVTAMVQGLYIVAATFILFRVDWGDPVGAMLLLITFAATGAGAGLLMGALFRNDQQASGISVVVALGLAALGGSMVPSELFSPTLQRISHLTPHAWALDGFAELVRRGGTVADIIPELAVLTAYAAVLFLIAGWRLRAVITRP